jgi:hydroxymethylbilane synthase
MTIPIRIGTRGSRLALWQANFVAHQLRNLPDARPVIVFEIETGGDLARERPLAEIAGEGVFTKEIQRALLDGVVDVAVHSLKDLPTLPVDGLVLAAVPARGPAGDVFVSRRYRKIDELPAGATVATSSVRRRAQLLHHRRDLRLVPIRGNVETRLLKLEKESLDGLILAEAGLERLELRQRITERLDPEWMLPAVGQGALGLECRVDDVATRLILEQLDHAPSRQAVTAERALLRGLGGGCQAPLGAIAQVADNTLVLRAAVLDPDGTKRVAGELSGSAERAEEVGCQLAIQLREKGAGELLNGRTSH